MKRGVQTLNPRRVHVNGRCHTLKNGGKTRGKGYLSAVKGQEGKKSVQDGKRIIALDMTWTLQQTKVLKKRDNGFFWDIDSPS